MRAIIRDPKALIKYLPNYSREDFENGYPHEIACGVSITQEEFEECLFAIERIETDLGIQGDFSVIGSEEDARNLFVQKKEKLIRFDLDGYRFDSYHRIYKNTIQIWDDIIGWYIISSSLVLPVNIIFNEDDEKEQIEMRYIAHGKIRSFVCSPSDLDDIKYIRKLKNLGIQISEHEEAIQGFLKDSLEYNRGKSIKIIKTTDHLGWYFIEAGNTYEFVPYSDQYLYSGKLMKHKSVDKLMKPTGDLDTWKGLMNSFRDKEHVVARIVLAAGFASVLVKILNAQTFAVDIWGTQSGSGKSISLSNAISVWAKPGIDDGYIKKADSTKLSLEAYTAFLNNLPLGIDETSTEDSRKRLAKFVYNICSEISHGALNPNGTLREQKNWDNCVILTGERPITTEQCFAGQLNRVIEIESPKHMFWDDSTRFMQHIQTLQNNYGTAGQQFVEILKQNGNIEYAKELFGRYYREMDKIATGKQAESAAVILTADRLAAEWIFNDDVILTVDDIRPFVKSDSEVNTNERIHQIILEWIAENKGKFEEGRDKQFGRFSSREGRRTCEIVKKSLDDFLGRYGFSLVGYLSWAKDTGKIYCKQDKVKNRHDVLVTFNGTSVRMVCIYVDQNDEE